MKARNTELKIYVGGKDVSQNFAGKIESFKYSDNLSGESDSCELEISDAARNLMRGQMPMRGTDFSFVIVKNNWNSAGGSLSLPLGSFEFDGLKYGSAPSKLILKFNSLPNKSGSRGIVKNRAWEETTLQEIAADIAGESGLKLHYEAAEIEIKRAEQKEASLPFLQRLCKNNGLNLKVADKKIIIFEVEKYEKQGAVVTLTPDLPVITRYEFDVKSTGIYSGAKNSYVTNGVANWLWSLFGLDGDILSAATEISSENGGGSLNLNERVDSKSESERLTKSRLHDENKKEWTVNFNVSGSFSFVAGNCFNLLGFGIFDGKWIVERSTHTLSNGYTTQFSAYRC